MLAKDTLEEFKLECELRRLTPRTIKGYYNSTLLFLTWLERHQDPEAFTVTVRNAAGVEGAGRKIHKHLRIISAQRVFPLHYIHKDKSVIHTYQVSSAPCHSVSGQKQEHNDQSQKHKKSPRTVPEAQCGGIVHFVFVG